MYRNLIFENEFGGDKNIFGQFIYLIDFHQTKLCSLLSVFSVSLEYEHCYQYKINFRPSDPGLNMKPLPS